jgi:hypothetical protein
MCREVTRLAGWHVYEHQPDLVPLEQAFLSSLYESGRWWWVKSARSTQEHISVP